MPLTISQEAKSIEPIEFPEKLPFGDVSANVSYYSQYVWRGEQQNAGQSAIQGGLDYGVTLLDTYIDFYAGIWGSNVNFNNGAGSELDYYFGYGTEMGSVGVDIGYIKFDYPDSDPDISFEEIYVGLSMGDLGLLFAMGQDGAPDYTEVSYGFGAVSFSYGQYDDYGDNLGVSYGFGCGTYDCAVTYTDFSDDGYGGDEDALVFSVSASF